MYVCMFQCNNPLFTLVKSLWSVYFKVFEISFFCSHKLHLFNQNYSKTENSNIVQYYCNFK